jgi:hypothetical protein
VRLVVHLRAPQHHLHRELRAVAAQRLQFHPLAHHPRRPALADAAHALLVVAPEAVGHDDVADRPTQHRFPRVAKQGLGRRVELDDEAGLVGRDDGGQRVVHDGRLVGLAASLAHACRALLAEGARDGVHPRLPACAELRLWRGVIACLGIEVGHHAECRRQHAAAKEQLAVREHRQQRCGEQGKRHQAGQHLGAQLEVTRREDQFPRRGRQGHAHQLLARCGVGLAGLARGLGEHGRAHPLRKSIGRLRNTRFGSARGRLHRGCFRGLSLPFCQHLIAIIDHPPVADAFGQRPQGLLDG